MKKILYTVALILIIIIAALTGLTIYQHNHLKNNVVEGNISTSTLAAKYQDVSEADIKNANYSVWGENVKFTDGEFKNTDPHDLLYSTVDYYTLGDINGDGFKDALVVTTSSRADSITDLHAVFKHDDEVFTTPLYIPVGERNTVKSINKVSISSTGIITLTLSILGPNDPTYDPTIFGNYSYRFVDNKLAPLK